MTRSLKSEYALRAIFDLAVQGNGAPVRSGDIARRQAIPTKFLEIILAALRHGGLVESRRGTDGGYLLARSPDTITIGEVLRLIDGNHSYEGRRRIHDSSTPFTHTWKQVDDAVSAIVDNTHFSKLIRDWQEHQRGYVPDWNI